MSDQPHAHAALSPGNKHDTHWVEGWVGPTAGLGIMKDKNFLVLPEFESPFAVLLA
jgi:hypothetical protein